jgi:CheY-like chemotaxis protein
MARTIRKRKRGTKRWAGGIVPGVAAQYGVIASQQEIDLGLSPNQIGSILGVTGEAVKQWIFHRRLPAVKLANGYWKVSKADLERFLRDRCGGVRRRVLVAGLDEGSVDLLREVSGAMGLEVIGVNSVFDARLKIQEQRPALCIVDCSSPEYGWDFVERVRSARFTKGCPVVVVTRAALGQAELKRALALEVQACLVKPLSAESLRGDIERLLNRRM